MIVCIECSHANPRSALICEQCKSILLAGPKLRPPLDPAQNNAAVPSGIVDLGTVARASVPTGVPVGQVPSGRPVTAPPLAERFDPAPAPSTPPSEPQPGPTQDAQAAPGITLKPPSRELRERVEARARAEALPGIPADLLGPLPGSAPIDRAPALSAVRSLTLNDRVTLHDAATRLRKGDEAMAAGDAAEGLAWYEAALQDDLRNRALLEKMVAAAERANDPVRLSRCLATLSQLAETPAERADYLIRAALVTRDGRKQPEKAAAGLLAALELDPDRLDAFLAVTEIYTEAQEWSALGEAYRLMIGAHSRKSEPNRKLLAKLWRKLGSLLAEQLGFHDDAVTALKTAALVDPTDLKNPATLYEIERRAGNLEAAAAALSDVVQLETDTSREVDDLRQLGELYLELGNRDAGYCCFRAIRYLGECHDREATFVDRLAPRGVRTPQRPLTARDWSLIYPPQFPFEVGRVFALLAVAVGRRLEHELSYHGVTSRDRLDPDSPLLFNRLLGGVGRAFGIEHLPEVYVKDGLEGASAINGRLDPPGFIVDRSLLSGQRPEVVAFAVGRLMALQKSDLYLGGICPINDLQVYLLGATRFVRPDVPIPMSKDIEWIVGALEERLSEAQQAELRKELGGLIERGAVIDLEDYLYWLDQTVNRLAFVIADDLGAAESFLLTDTKPLTTASVDARIDHLVRYSVSPAYLELRRELGLQVGTAVASSTAIPVQPAPGRDRSGS